MTEPRHTADTITDDELDRLYAERDELLAELGGRDEEARERWVQKQLAETGLRAADFRNGMTMEIEPARDLVAHWVGAARAMLGNAPNYTETPIEMEVKVAEDPERFAFILQRVGYGALTPHQARQRAEEERDGAYRERAQLLAWLAALVPAVLAPAPDIDEDGWQLLFLHTPQGQLSWHIHPRDVPLFDHAQRVQDGDARARWDGHTTEEKYDRIRALISCPACLAGVEHVAPGVHCPTPETHNAGCGCPTAQAPGAVEAEARARALDAVSQLGEALASAKAENARLRAERDRARRDSAALENQLAAARDLHQRRQFTTSDICGHCSGWGGDGTWPARLVAWPCDTTRAIEERP
ncbi:hypothetical protein [Streptomyces sp. B15]|uniref:hypothetical protein n=1 Tax=Streptomyces sp. B15 TaxID=1537797 RepID=UPI001B37839E|nr:hypothetical protein [Streptomyces sp. B15]MBQ1122612.1 hypothetical protein [Streptomyces sp. B15]